MMGVGPVHTLPSTCLQKVEEQPEDADNQRNVTRMGSQPSELSTTVHIPVTLTGPPEETTVVPSEYLPVPVGHALLSPLLSSVSAAWGQSMPLQLVPQPGDKVLCCPCLRFDTPLLSGVPEEDDYHDMSPKLCCPPLPRAECQA